MSQAKLFYSLYKAPDPISHCYHIDICLNYETWGHELVITHINVTGLDIRMRHVSLSYKMIQISQLSDLPPINLWILYHRRLKIHKVDRQWPLHWPQHHNDDIKDWIGAVRLQKEYCLPYLFMYVSVWARKCWEQSPSLPQCEPPFHLLKLQNWYGDVGKPQLIKKKSLSLSWNCSTNMLLLIQPWHWEDNNHHNSLQFISALPYLQKSMSHSQTSIFSRFACYHAHWYYQPMCIEINKPVHLSDFSSNLCSPGSVSTWMTPYFHQSPVNFFLRCVGDNRVKLKRCNWCRSEDL